MADKRETGSPPEPNLHTIRLHGPWQLDLSGSSQVRIKIPGLLFAQESPSLGAVSNQSVWLQRSFGLPTELSPDQKVWLLIDQADFTGDVELNRRSLGGLAVDGVFRAEVQDWLSRRNRLRIEVGFDRGNAAPRLNQVQLEIEEAR